MLTKPLGFGVTTTALKRDQADPADVAEVVGWMKRLNKQAAELALEFGVRGGTDITGFSLLGHAWEMAEASGVGLRFDLQKIPFTRGARSYAEEWIFPGGASDNRLYFRRTCSFAAQIAEHEQMLLFDPQTSGGLLLAVPARPAGSHAAAGLSSSSSRCGWSAKSSSGSEYRRLPESF